MKWNIYNRVTVLEQQAKDLTDFSGDYSRWTFQMEEKIKKLENANKILVNSNQALIGNRDNIVERLKNLEHELYVRSRQTNPSAEAFEQQKKDLADFIDSVKQWLGQLTGDVKRLEKQSFDQAMAMCKAGIAPDPRMPVFAVLEADKEKEKKRQYQREWYAKKKAKKEEEGKAKSRREKKNAYARAYYARTKGAKQ